MFFETRVGLIIKARKTYLTAEETDKALNNEKVVMQPIFRLLK